MVEVSPFAAVRYDATRFDENNLSDVLAPPYDVLDAADKEALLARSEWNIAAVDLPHVPPKSAGPAEVYQQAAALLDAWIDGGTLIHESRPAVYVYHQRFDHEGKTYTRRMFMARVRLEPLGEGSILPHEQTFGGPKEDRLALMLATGCQLSPIFGLYNDPANEVIAALEQNTGRPPDATGVLDGVENRLWVVGDPAVHPAVSCMMAERKIYIADGHHRYGTALLYRDGMAQQHGGPLPADHPANFVMFVLAGMDDPGCLILPYHRVLGGIDAGKLLERWREGVEPAAGVHADMTLYDGRSGTETPVRFTRRALLKTIAPGHVAPWYELDYAYLHRYLMDELHEGGTKARRQDDTKADGIKRVTTQGRNGTGSQGIESGEARLHSAASDAVTAPAKRPSSGRGGVSVHYVTSVAEARRLAGQLGGVALLMNATPMSQLRAVSEAGGLMPQKSTCFHPKLATGLTFYPLS